MMKLNFQYDHNSARLNVEGLPDKSLGHDDSHIGIISSWSLQLIGLPTLEGKKIHLQSLIEVVLPYTRHYLSGVRRSFGDTNSPINIKPVNKYHQLMVSIFLLVYLHYLLLFSYQPLLMIILVLLFLVLANKLT